MIDERVMRVWAQVGKQTQGGKVTVAAICAAAVAGVGVDAAGVTLTAGAGAGRRTVHATNRIALELEQWQSAFRHGPGVDAHATGGPVFAVDLASPAEQDRWPDFAHAALASGVRAVFALPMQVGAIRLGVVDLYRAGPGLMSPYELADALTFVESTALLLWGGVAGAPPDTAELAWQRDETSAHHAGVHQATGMLAVRLGVTAASAFARLRADALARSGGTGGITTSSKPTPAPPPVQPTPQPARPAPQLERPVPQLARRSPQETPAGLDVPGSRPVAAHRDAGGGVAGAAIAESFVELAEALVGDVDPMEFLQQVTVTGATGLGGAAAGVLLSDQRGALRVAAASTEQALELMQRHTEQGPSPECFRTGRPVAAADLDADVERWPSFVAQARSSGFASALAVPMRLGGDLVGVLTVYGTRPMDLDAGTVRLGQALADMATIGLLRRRELRGEPPIRTIRPREALVEQLQATINDRITVEQAKGVIAERLRLDMDRSFALLRDTASRDSRRLSDLARAVVDGSEAAF